MNLYVLLPLVLALACGLKSAHFNYKSIYPYKIYPRKTHAILGFFEGFIFGAVVGFVLSFAAFCIVG